MDEHDDLDTVDGLQDTLENDGAAELSVNNFPLALPTVGRYELVTRIGQSAGGDEIYLCKHEESDSIDEKLFMRLRTGRASEDQDALERFQKDHFVGSSVQHKNLVRSVDLIRSEQSIAVVSEYASNGTLAQKLKANPVIDIEEATRLFTSVCSGVAALHSEGIVHGQISPSHVFLFKNGDVKIGDFGCALLQDPKLSVKNGSNIGSPLYAPPEFLEAGMTSAAMDVYALGLVLFETLTGVYPFKAQNMVERVTAQIEAKVPELLRLRSDAPRVLHEVISIATRKDPSNRYGSVEEMLEHLSEGISPVARVVLAGKSLVQRVKSSIVGKPDRDSAGRLLEHAQSYVSSADNTVYVHRAGTRMGGARR